MTGLTKEDFYSNDMAIPKMNADQLRWQAESDAETMARYEEIMNDSKRRSAAVKVAREKASDLTTRANAMNRVASSKPAKSNKK